MAVFHESDAAAAGGKKQNTLIIVLIVAVVLLCCCCIAVVGILIATGTITTAKIKDLTNSNSFLPTIYLLN